MKYIYILFVALCFLACKNRSSVDIVDKSPNPVKKTVLLRKSPLNAVLNIERLGLLDSMIVCKSVNTDNLFYCLDRKTFAVIDSMGVKGGGAEEFVAPHFISGAHSWMVADNGRRDIVWKKNGITTRRVPLNIQTTLFNPMFYADSLLCFVENYPNKLIWRLYNYETGETVDKVVFKDEDEKENASLNDFTYGIGTDYLAIAQLNFNKIFIYERKNEKMELRHIVRGEEVSGKLYYSNIACSHNRIYALYQGNVNLENQTGKSLIEVYSLDGKLLESLEIDIIADRFLLDEENNRILLLSPFDDDNIYFLSL